MNYKYLLLDWDGCVADTLSIWVDAYAKTFNEYNLNPTEKEIIKDTFGKHHGPITLGILKEQIDEFMKKVYLRMQENIIKVTLHKDVSETLESLKNHVEMCVVTSSRRELFEKALEAHNMTHLFEFSITGEDVVKHKPDPEAIQLALKRFSGATIENTLIVGDSDKDVVAGQNAGMDTAIFYPEINKRFYRQEDLENLNPTHFIQSFDDLKSIVLE
jgi:pyrophosphatase PpaX